MNSQQSTTVVGGVGGVGGSLSGGMGSGSMKMKDKDYGKGRGSYRCGKVRKIFSCGRLFVWLVVYFCH